MNKNDSSVSWSRIFYYGVDFKQGNKRTTLLLVSRPRLDVDLIKYGTIHVQIKKVDL